MLDSLKELIEVEGLISDLGVGWLISASEVTKYLIEMCVILLVSL